MKNKKVIFGILVAIGLTSLWFITFNVRSIMIDNEIENLQKADDSQDDYNEVDNIVDVKAVIDGVNIELKDLQSLDKLPTTLDVIITYDEGKVSEKPAYISYSDVTEAEYIDNSYGRILLPESWYKE